MIEQDTFDAIIADVAAGEATYKALHSNGSNYRAFYGELAVNPEAREKYARAKADGMERLADEILSIADESRPGLITTTKADGSVEIKESDMVDRARLQIDSRKWLLSKLVPKKYGDKVDLTHAGADGGPIQLQQIRRIIVKPGHPDT